MAQTDPSTGTSDRALGVPGGTSGVARTAEVTGGAVPAGSAPSSAGSGGLRSPHRPRWRDRRGRWRRGWVLAVGALLLGALMLLHSRVPNAVGNLGSLLQTFLPWAGVPVLLIIIGALWRRSVTALVAVLVPVVSWFNLFGGLLTDKTGDAGELLVVSHNVDADNPDPTGTADQLAESDADLLALQEIPHEQQETYETALAEAYPYHSLEGTVGLWSRYPLEESRPVDIGMDWPRAMRATVETPDGERLAAYVAHLPSVRVEVRSGFTAGQRDEAADRLGQEIAEEPVDDLILLGDLNGTMNDRALAPLTSQLRSTQGAAGAGFGFSFPAEFPMTRIDQILVRSVEPRSSWTMEGTGSDHLPVAARLDW